MTESCTTLKHFAQERPASYEVGCSAVRIDTQPAGYRVRARARAGARRGSARARAYAYTCTATPLTLIYMQDER